jgi:hypothetical protein
MDQSEIRERIERAHRKAAYGLKDYLEEFMTEEPDFSRSKEYYCKCFISELYVNSAGVKDYDRDDLSDLMPCALSEFKKLNEHVNDVILAYKQSRLNRKIILRSALAILASRFTQEDISKYDIYSYSETRICISYEDDFSYKSKKMTLKTLLSKIESASSIKDLMK